MPRKKVLQEIPFVDKNGAVIEVKHKVTGEATRYEVTQIDGALAKLIKVDENNKRLKGRPVTAVMVMPE